MVIPPSSRRGKLIVARKRLSRRFTGRGRVIAAQAAIVAVLIAIVYATFLQGGDTGTLSGIDAPGAERAQRADGGPDANRRASAGRGRRGGGGDGSGGGGGAGTGSGGEGIASGAGGAPADLFASTGAPTPSGDQYSDSLAVLKAQLGVNPGFEASIERRASSGPGTAGLSSR